jgi:hypothetical protein
MSATGQLHASLTASNELVVFPCVPGLTTE